MSFAVTAAEEARVQIFKSRGIDLEPRQAADLIMVIAITTAYFIQLLAVLFMLVNREYPPIKAKNPWTMLAIFITSIFWFIGDLQANGHAPLYGTPLAKCKAFGIWMHILMGVCAVSAIIGLRSYGLYQIFHRNRPFIGTRLYVSVAFIAGSLLAFGIVTEALPDNVSVYYIDGFDMCNYSYGFQVAVFVFIWISWVVVAALSWRIRNVKSSFNESREAAISCAVVFGVLIFMTALSYTERIYPVSVKLRVLATSLTHFSAVLTWWLPMAVPLYKCLTDRKAYQKQWIFKLRQDGLQRAYHINTASTEGETASSGNSPYLYQCKADQRYSTHAAPLGKELCGASANGEFFYSANSEAHAEKPMAQVCSGMPDSSASSRNGDDEIGVYPGSSASNLVQHPQAATARC
ncbi:hypothetical protein IW152_005104 [Coemansia sp. BCRC 34962]|nr:hypothetical protein IW152_005104 [Coemansia sp. BCRC 34962]